MKLTAAQQLRLDELTARESDLNASELAELGFLRTLATTEEPAPDDESKKTEPSEDDTAPLDPTTESSAKKPGIFDRALASMKSRGVLADELAAVRAELASVTSASAARIAALEAENADYASRAHAGEAFAARVAELESERHTVSTAAAHIAAANHVDPTDLPETSAETIASIDELRAQLAQTTDPREKAALIGKIRSIRFGSQVALN